MLIFLVYLFTFIGSFLLVIAAIIKLKFIFPQTDHDKLIASVLSFHIKFPEQFITSNKSCIVAYNKTCRKVAIGILNSDSQKKASATLYSYHEILGCELVENALTLTKVSNSSLIKLREVREAGFSEIESTLSTSEHIAELTLKIYIKGLSTQALCISFLPTTSLKKTDIRYTHTLSEAFQLYKRLNEIIIFTNQEDGIEQNNKLKKLI